MPPLCCESNNQSIVCHKSEQLISVLVNDRYDVNHSFVHGSRKYVNHNNLVTVPQIKTIEICESNRTADRKTLNNRNRQCTNQNLINVSTLSEGKITDHPCKLAILNAQSVCNKTNEITEFISEHKTDFILITETWISDHTSYVCAQLTPPGYSLCQAPRLDKRGGGTAILCKSSYHPKTITTSKFNTFESICNDVTVQSGTICIACVYRPPGEPKHEFFQEFTLFLEETSLNNKQLIVAGDFNIHVDKKENPSTQKLFEILDNFHLTQHVNFGTHASDHCLDLLITRQDDPLINHLKRGPFLSDHFAILCDLNVKNIDFVKEKVVTRNIKDIDLGALKQDIANEVINIETTVRDPDAIVGNLNTCLRSILDKHAPLRLKLVAQRPPRPWFNEEINTAKRERRRLERRLQKHNTEENRTKYKIAKNIVNKLTDTEKQRYFLNEIENNTHDQKALFRTFDKLTGNKKSSQYPKAESAKELADNFANFFKDKIDNIGHSFEGSDLPVAQRPGAQREPNDKLFYPQ